MYNVNSAKYNVTFDLKFDSFYNFLESLREESKKHYYDYCEKNNRSDDDDDDRYYKAINDSYENYQAEIEREDCEEFPEVCDNLYNGYESH